MKCNNKIRNNWTHNNRDMNEEQKKCKCDLRTKLVGDGCDICNPELALDHARDYIKDLEDEIEVLKEEIREWKKECGYL